MDGYGEARKIEKRIRQILAENPITQQNALEWMNFSRTISSGLDLLVADAILAEDGVRKGYGKRVTP